jgi:tartrate dehydratase alpha subunit/fumarate hydratase class I-like protein
MSELLTEFRLNPIQETHAEACPANLIPVGIGPSYRENCIHLQSSQDIIGLIMSSKMSGACNTLGEMRK